MPELPEVETTLRGLQPHLINRTIKSIEIKQPKLLKKTLLSLAVLGVLLVISYAMADDGATLNASGLILEDGEAGSTSKWVSTGITYSLVLGGVGILAIFAGFFKSLVRK